jgi:hypothetical protein
MEPTITTIAEQHARGIARITAHNTHLPTVVPATKLVSTTSLLRLAPGTEPITIRNGPQRWLQAVLVEPAATAVTEQHVIVALRPARLAALARGGILRPRGRRLRLAASTGPTACPCIGSMCRTLGLTIAHHQLRSILQHASQVPAHHVKHQGAMPTP